MTTFFMGMVAMLALLFIILTIWTRGGFLLLLFVVIVGGLSKLFGGRPWG